MKIKVFLALAVLCITGANLGWSQPPQNIDPLEGNNAQEPAEPHKFDGEEAYQRLIEICDIGTRISTSDGMAKQQAMIEEYMKALGGEVSYQAFNATNPINSRLVELKNMVVRWHPERTKRLLLCCHYDTRPFADRDPVDPRGVFLGANDGASGVALLFELAK